MVHMEQINGEIYEKLVSKLAEDELWSRILFLVHCIVKLFTFYAIYYFLLLVYCGYVSS